MEATTRRAYDCLYRFCSRGFRIGMAACSFVILGYVGNSFAIVSMSHSLYLNSAALFN
jgi:hypothetical protein